MGTKATPRVKSKKSSSPPIVRKKPKRVRQREPRKIVVNPTDISTFGERSLDFIGGDNLAPYVWVILKGDEEREFILETNPIQGGDNLPSRQGLKSIRLLNEHGKFPSVELELYVSEYRSAYEDHNPQGARPLRKFRVGAEFSVKWGWRSAHTQWGYFRITERDIQFDQGTALLRVKGSMGYKMASTTSSEVFSASYGVSAIDQISRLIGMDVNYESLLEQEYARLKTESSDAVTAGGTLASAIWKETNKADVDMLYDPESDALRLVTPFKFDLIGRGARPIKMTYGFPFSPIEKLEVKTKHPIKAGTGARSTKGVKPSQVNDIGKNTFISIVKGTLVTGSGYYDVLNFGYSNFGPPPPTAYLNVTAFPNGPDNTVLVDEKLETTRSNVILNAEKKYPPSQGYIVSINEDYNIKLPPASAGYYHVIVKRKFTKPSGFQIVRDDLAIYNTAKASGKYTEQELLEIQLEWADQSEINQLSQRALNGEIAFEFQGSSVKLNKDGRTFIKYPIKLFSTISSDRKALAPKGGSSGEQELGSTSQTAQVRPDVESRPEGDEFVDVPIENKNNEYYINSVTLAEYEKGSGNITTQQRRDILAFKRREQELIEQAKVAGNQRVIRRPLQTITTLTLQERRPEASTKKSQSTSESSETASADDQNARSDAKPLGVSSGKGRSSRRVTLTTLKIKMKAGDWTLKTGTLIELIDIYETIDGTYYVHGEEHIISAAGFSTQITCKKATSKQVTSYGQPFKKSTRKPTSGEKGEVAKGKESKEQSTTIIASDQLRDDLATVGVGKKMTESRKAQSSKRSFEALRSRNFPLQ